MCSLPSITSQNPPLASRHAVVGTPGGPPFAEQFEERLSERVHVLEGHGRPPDREVHRRERCRARKPLGGTVGGSFAAQMSGDSKGEPGFHLVVVEVGYVEIGVGGNQPVANPGPDLVHVLIWPHPREVHEHVRADLSGVGAGNRAVAIDPDDRGDITHRIEFGQDMIPIEQDREGDSCRELADIVGRLVEGDRDDHEAVVGEFIVQRLPPGQVVAATSPTGEGHEQPLSVLELLERMAVAVEIRQREIGGLATLQRSPPIRGAHTDGRDCSGLVDEGGRTEQRRRGHEINVIAVAHARFLPHGNADLPAAQSLGSEFPSERGREVARRDQDSPVSQSRIDRCFPLGGEHGQLCHVSLVI